MTGFAQWQDDRLWGAKQIAAFAGVCSDTIAAWEKLAGCPITKINGRYFVTKSALIAWLTTKVLA